MLEEIERDARRVRKIDLKLSNAFVMLRTCFVSLSMLLLGMTPALRIAMIFLVVLHIFSMLLDLPSVLVCVRHHLLLN